MSKRGFYGWKKQETAKKRKRIVAEWGKELQENVRASATSSLIYVAPKMLQAVVNQVGFSDYTGVLVNSYMAGMFVNGKYAGDMSNIGLPGVQQGNPRAVWSSAEPDVKTISIKKGRPYIRSKNKFVMNNGRKTGLHLYEHTRERSGNVHWLINKRTYRNPRSPEFIPFKKEEFSPTGYGRNLSILKSCTPTLRRGTEIIITNGAPYAKRVQNQKGSNVYPKGISGSYLSIVRNELEKNLRKLYGSGLRR